MSLAPPRHPGRRAGWLLTLVWFTVGGLGHFVNPGFFVSICPPWLPAPLAVVYASGVIELVLAALLLPTGTRPPAGRALQALIVAVTPVHVWMVVVPEQFPQFPEPLLWLRIVIQIAFFLVVGWSTRPEPAAAGPDQRISPST